MLTSTPVSKKTVSPRTSSLQNTPTAFQEEIKTIENDINEGNYELALPATYELLNYQGDGQDGIHIQAGLFLSKLYYSLGCIPHSVQFVQEAFKIIKNGDANLDVAFAYHLIGNIYALTGDTQQAFIYLSKGLEIYHYLNHKPGLSESYALIAQLNLDNQEYDQARFYAEKSFSHSSGIDALKHQQAAALNTLGLIYLHTGQIGSASRKIQQAANIIKDLKAPYEQSRSFMGMAQLANEHGDSKTAKSFAKRSLKISQKINACGCQKEGHYFLASQYKKEQNFQAAFSHLEHILRIDEKKNHQKALSQLRSFEINHKTEMFTRRNTQLKQEIQQRTKEQAELEFLATIDPLTGLYNRRYFFTLAEHICEQAKSNSDKLCAIMMDIDHFKKINDNNGHPFGDQVLVSISKLIQNNLRENDILCRFGGEEFCALLPETEIKQAFQIAERVRQNIQTQNFAIDSQAFAVTISIGVADLKHSPKQSLMGLIGYADQALYTSKRNGRNQVSIFQN